MIETIDPRTGETVATHEYDSGDAVEAALARSVEAGRAWAKTEWSERRAALFRARDMLNARSAEFAAMITREMGKLDAEARAEVAKAVGALAALAEDFPRWRAERESTIDGGFTLALRPLGPLLGIMPWNFPLWQVVRFAVPAMLAGNTILLKHATGVWGSAKLIGEVFDACFPRGVYQNLSVDHAVAERLIGDFRVRGVSLTGSRRAGQRVGELAGRALKTCVLELGGSDAYVILDDADLDLAARVCARSRLLNAGQSCVSAKRFVVTDKNHDAFLAKFTDEIRGRAVAPLARGDLRDLLSSQTAGSVAAGARVHLAGGSRDGRGFYFDPVILADVRPGQPAFDDELFGPVAAVVRAADEADALQLANRSIYGLGGAVFSRDIVRAKKIATEELKCGMAFVNEMVRSDVSVPFGGIKDSGVGRELGRDGAFAFTNLKVVFG